MIVRPGYVYGQGKSAITGRVGIGSFGIFLHLGGGNRIPLTYVENCADAIVLAGLKKAWMARFSMWSMTICPAAAASSACISAT